MNDEQRIAAIRRRSEIAKSIPDEPGHVDWYAKDTQALLQHLDEAETALVARCGERDSLAATNERLWKALQQIVDVDDLTDAEYQAKYGTRAWQDGTVAIARAALGQEQR